MQDRDRGRRDDGLELLQHHLAGLCPTPCKAKLPFESDAAAGAANIATLSNPMPGFRQLLVLRIFVFPFDQQCWSKIVVADKRTARALLTRAACWLVGVDIVGDDVAEGVRGKLVVGNPANRASRHRGVSRRSRRRRTVAATPRSLEVVTRFWCFENCQRSPAFIPEKWTKRAALHPPKSASHRR
jgi:hypothetical protein